MGNNEREGSLWVGGMVEIKNLMLDMGCLSENFTSQ